MMPRNLVAAALAASLVMLPQAEAQQPAAPTASEPAAAPGEPDLAKGKKAYQRYCSVCHGMRGEGALGPALQGISKRMTQEDITRQLMEPRGSMPKMYPTPIDDKIWADIRSYLMQLP
ncbi:cytochrome c [Variovorax robiniae]|uniref:Cytochrome c n=1 Tax=Variovorax robiniae TaxID=1836199 RepID=A0ABU8XH51_9BURK